MKRFIFVVLCIIVVFSAAGCLSINADYKVLNPLYEGGDISKYDEPIKIEYSGVVYTQSGVLDGDPSGKSAFHIDYGEICSSVAYDAYIDGDTMYLKAKQPFLADCTAVSFILISDENAETEKQ